MKDKHESIYDLDFSELHVLNQSERDAWHKNMKKEIDARRRKVEEFYNENADHLDTLWAEHCFYEGRFETGKDAQQVFDDYDNLLEFVDEIMEKVK